LSADLAGQSPLNQAMFTRRLLFLVIASYFALVSRPRLPCRDCCAIL
jgi:hypothetical protein